MRRCTGYLVLILVLVFASTSSALCDTFFVYDQYGGTWQDANKTGSDDSLMCWAATASNILEWGGWGTSQYNTSQSIFQDFVSHWTDNTGYMSWAWQWWFNGSGPPVYSLSYPDVPGAGDYYPTVNFSNYFSGASGGNLMAAIDLALHQGQGVGMIIGSGSSSHAVTVWGYSYSAPRDYTSIFITDSDDGYYGLREYPLIYQNNEWYIGGGAYSGWEIYGIQTLAFDPSSSTFSSLDNVPSSGESAVPLAPSWVLFGTGLSSLFLLRRRRRPGKRVSSDF